MRRNTPNSRLDWFRYYAKRYDKTNNETAAHMACWYLLLHMAFET